MEFNFAGCPADSRRNNDNPSPAADANAPAHRRSFQRIAHRLNLTDDQKAQIRTVWRSEKDTLRSMLAQLHSAWENLRAASGAGDANEAAMRAVLAKVAAVEADWAE
jgi:Spy/CpxP family protein refolding chaperone